MIHLHNSILFPSLIRHSETNFKSWGSDNPEKTTTIYKLDWDAVDRIKTENWMKRAVTSDSVFPGTLPQRYDGWAKGLLFAIPNTYLEEIRRCSRLAKIEWGTERHFDTMIREICLKPAIEYTYVAFRLMVDCLYDSQRNYFERGVGKHYATQALLYKFWCHQTGRGLIKDLAKFSLITWHLDDTSPTSSEDKQYIKEFLDSIDKYDEKENKITKIKMSDITTEGTLIRDTTEVAVPATTTQASDGLDKDEEVAEAPGTAIGDSLEAKSSELRSNSVAIPDVSIQVRGDSMSIGLTNCLVKWKGQEILMEAKTDLTGMAKLLKHMFLQDFTVFKERVPIRFKGVSVVRVETELEHPIVVLRINSTEIKNPEGSKDGVVFDKKVLLPGYHGVVKVIGQVKKNDLKSLEAFKDAYNNQVDPKTENDLGKFSELKKAAKKVDAALDTSPNSDTTNMLIEALQKGVDDLPKDGVDIEGLRGLDNVKVLVSGMPVIEMKAYRKISQKQIVEMALGKEEIKKYTKGKELTDVTYIPGYCLSLIFSRPKKKAGKKTEKRGKRK